MLLPIKPAESQKRTNKQQNFYLPLLVGNYILTKTNWQAELDDMCLFF